MCGLSVSVHATLHYTCATSVSICDILVFGELVLHKELYAFRKGVLQRFRLHFFREGLERSKHIGWMVLSQQDTLSQSQPRPIQA